MASPEIATPLSYQVLQLRARRGELTTPKLDPANSVRYPHLPARISDRVRGQWRLDRARDEQESELRHGNS